MNIDYTKECDIELSEEEKNTILKAGKILHDIANDLWRNDMDETEYFGLSSEVASCISDFLKACGFEINRNFEEVSK